MPVNKKYLLFAVLILVLIAVLCAFRLYKQRQSVMPTTGNWGTPTDPSVSAELADDLARAAELQYPELAIEPLEVLAVQVVGGFKYRILCNVTEEGKSAKREVTLYVNPEREPDIMGID